MQRSPRRARPPSGTDAELWLAKGRGSMVLGTRASHRFSSTPDRDRAFSLQLAAEAYQLAPNDALTLTLSSGALVLARRLDEADRRLERALALDPGRLCLGWPRLDVGLSGRQRGGDPRAFHGPSSDAFRTAAQFEFIGMGCAHFAAGRYDRAVRWVESGVRTSRGSFWAQRVAVAAAAMTGS